MPFFSLQTKAIHKKNTKKLNPLKNADKINYKLTVELAALTSRENEHRRNIMNTTTAT